MGWCHSGFFTTTRLKQVDEYLAATGQTVELKGAPERRYGLLSTLYNNQKNLMLNLPDLEDYGAREVIPFGFRLSTASEIELAGQNENMAESTVRPFIVKASFRSFLSILRQRDLWHYPVLRYPG